MKNSKTMILVLGSLALSVGSAYGMQGSRKGQKSRAQAAPSCQNGTCGKPVSERYARLLAVTQRSIAAQEAVAAAPNGQAEDRVMRDRPAAQREGAQPQNVQAQEQVVVPVGQAVANNGANLIAAGDADVLNAPPAAQGQELAAPAPVAQVVAVQDQELVAPALMEQVVAVQDQELAAPAPMAQVVAVQGQEVVQVQQEAAPAGEQVLQADAAGFAGGEQQNDAIVPGPQSFGERLWGHIENFVVAVCERVAK